MNSPGYYVGVDIGGTFTDCAVVDHRGEIIATTKSPSTPVDPSRGVAEVLSVAAQRLGLSLSELLRQSAGFVHGSTVATNAMLERKGALTGLVTTKGHEDTLLVGRVYQKVAGLSEREMIHESHFRKPDPPIVPRQWIKGVSERVDYRGRAVVRLNEAEVISAIDDLASQGVKAMAVCFLWSFLNGDHERRVKDIILSRHPETFVVISSDVACVMGEYERTVTAVLSACIGPSVSAYLRSLRDFLEERGLRSDILLMHSGGGVTTVDDASAHPILLLDSGPTGGTLAAQFYATIHGHPNVICTDMGGTSFDVSLITNGDIHLEKLPVIQQYTFVSSKVEVVSIGAGGGSIAWIDPDRLLRVGPHSAKAAPGPACYDNGGTEATVTDADLILGYLNPEYFLGGRMPLIPSRAEEAMAKIANEIGMSVLDTAAGIVRIVNAQMADLIRKSTIEKGIDPRRFAFFSYGGAGAVHACFIAKELGIEDIYVPATASVFSALGMCVADMVHVTEMSRPYKLPLSTESVRTINDTYDKLEGKLRQQFEAEGVPASDVTWTRFMYLKYRLQVHEVAITLPSRELRLEDESLLEDSFEKRYREIFGPGSGYREAGIDIVKYRVEGRHKRAVSEPSVSRGEVVRDPAQALKGRRRAYFDKTHLDTDVYDGARLYFGNRLPGPAIVEREGDTIVIPPFADGEVDEFLNVRIRIRH